MGLPMPDGPKILVFDSGLGGLTVLAELRALRPDATLIYTADNAGFPYGSLSEATLVDRVLRLMRQLLTRFVPDAVVIACNTASTLVLPHLRAQFPKTPFIGTVPAVKPAAEATRSGLISVLATPGTVARDYTRDLIATYASHCEVSLIGSANLASLAEAHMKGEPTPLNAIAEELAPCFQTRNGARTDCVVLACTHYPLLLPYFLKTQPWPVDWIDPAPAIARRVDHILTHELRLPAQIPENPKHLAVFTSESPVSNALALSLVSYKLENIAYEPMPLLFA